MIVGASVLIGVGTAVLAGGTFGITGLLHINDDRAVLPTGAHAWDEQASKQLKRTLRRALRQREGPCAV
jgi:hypothetical protein